MADQPEYSPHRNNNNNDHLSSSCNDNGILQDLAGNRRKDSAIEQSEDVKKAVEEIKKQSVDQKEELKHQHQQDRAQTFEEEEKDQ